jgi:hypothetical protein
MPESPDTVLGMLPTSRLWDRSRFLRPGTADVQTTKSSTLRMQETGIHKRNGGAPGKQPGCCTYSSEPAPCSALGMTPVMALWLTSSTLRKAGTWAKAARCLRVGGGCAMLCHEVTSDKQGEQRLQLMGLNQRRHVL